MVGIKLNSVEFQAGGFSAEGCRELCNTLENEGQFDFVELSGGTYELLTFGHKRESTKKREAFFLEFAEAIVPGLQKTKTYVTGGLRTVGAMVEALKPWMELALQGPYARNSISVRISRSLARSTRSWTRTILV